MLTPPDGLSKACLEDVNAPHDAEGVGIGASGTVLLFKPNHHKSLLIIRTQGVQSDTDGEGAYRPLLLGKWVDDRIDRFDNPYDLCLDLAGFIRTDALECGIEITALAGYFQRGIGPVSFYAKIGSTDFHSEISLENGINAIYSGDNDYVREFDRDKTRLYTENHGKLIKVLESVRKRFAESMPYNPVGGEWVVKELTY